MKLILVCRARPNLTVLTSPIWTVTHKQGINTLIGNYSRRLVEESFKVLDSKGNKGKCPRFWDGKTADRIIPVLSSAHD